MLHSTSQSKRSCIQLQLLQRKNRQLQLSCPVAAVFSSCSCCKRRAASHPTRFCTCLFRIFFGGFRIFFPRSNFFQQNLFQRKFGSKSYKIRLCRPQARPLFKKKSKVMWRRKEKWSKPIFPRKFEKKSGSFFLKTCIYCMLLIIIVATSASPEKKTVKKLEKGPAFQVKKLWILLNTFLLHVSSRAFTSKICLDLPQRSKQISVSFLDSYI